MQTDEIFNKLLTKCEEYYNSEEIRKITEAYQFGLQKHAGKMRLNGLPYMTHPLGVMEILLDMCVDAETIMASLIHETMNHAGATKEEIESLFGTDVANIVWTISKINRLELQDDSEYSAMNLRKVLVGMSEDIRVLFLKLADRLHNLRTADALSEEDRKRKVNETMTVLIPIAHRLGMYKIKGEMEDLCLKYSKPDVYNDILERLNATQEELKESLKDMENSISEMLTEQNIPFHIKSRVKSVYSIYNKLNNGKTWEKIYDILALRVIVEKVSECYLTVGLIHAKYRPIPGRFKDYIAMPKANMYQSLHTGVFGSDGHRYEVQIRTEEMDEFAEKGVASHFAYKEKHYVKSIMEQKLEIFRNLIESSENLSDAQFASEIKSDLLNDSIYVFTPKGDVLELPKGSTPLDFAYRIHTGVGDKTVGAIVNDAIVPLNYELQTNDIVKIKTSSTGVPNKEWLNFVKTSHARNKIKAYFSKQEKDIYTEKGKTILNNELRKRHLSFDTVLSNENVKKICADLKLENVEDIYFSIGSLRFTASYIISLATEEKKDVRDVLIEKVLNNDGKNTNHKKERGMVLVNGEDGIMTNLAKCCHPIFGDEIVGFITKGEGVTVHRKNCQNVKNEPERLIDVSWNSLKESSYFAKILVTCETGKNYLLDIIGKATSKNVYVDAVKTKANLTETLYELTVKTSGKEALEGFMNSLMTFRFVKEVTRK